MALGNAVTNSIVKNFTIELVTALPNAVTKMIVKYFHIYLGAVHPKMRSMKNTIRLLIYE